MLPAGIPNFPNCDFIVLLYRKLALFDEWNSLAVYVSMDNTVVIEDISESPVCLTFWVVGDEVLPHHSETGGER